MLTVRSKVVFSVLIAASLGVFGAGCDKSKSRAKSVISKYVVTEAVGAKEAQKKYLIQEDRALIDEMLAEERSVLESSKMAEIAREQIGDKFSVEIVSHDRSNGSMRVEAKVTRPDPEVLEEILVGETMSAAKKLAEKGEEKVEEAMLESIRSALEKREIPTRTDTETFRLRKENGEWRIDRDMKGRQKLKEQIDTARKLSIDGAYQQALGQAESIQNKIETSGFESLRSDLKGLRVSILSGQAREFLEDGAYEKAIQNYEKIIELDPKGPFAPLNAEQARQKLEAVQREMKRSADGGGRDDAQSDTGEQPDAGSP